MTNPWQSKPGVDWAGIEVRVKAGETFASISRSLAESGVKISAWAINKHSRKHGWLGQKTITATDWFHLCRNTTTARSLTAPQTASDSQIVRYGLRTLPRMAEILEHIQTGATHKAAALASGISELVLSEWLKSDPEFRALTDTAEGRMVTRNLARIDRAAEQDWRAADKLLSSVPAAREHWTPPFGGQGSQGPGGVTVVINVKRAYDVEPVLTILPDAPPAQEPPDPPPSTK